MIKYSRKFNKVISITWHYDIYLHNYIGTLGGVKITVNKDEGVKTELEFFLYKINIPFTGVFRDP